MSPVSFFDQIDAWATASAVIVAMACAWGVGWWVGQRHKVEGREPPAEKLGDASLALFALLLAFGFGMALQKHDHRRQMVVAESNAIGDFYTCAGLLREPLRDELQAVIRSYAQLLVKARRNVYSPIFKQASPAGDGLHQHHERSRSPGGRFWFAVHVSTDQLAERTHQHAGGPCLCVRGPSADRGRPGPVDNGDHLDRVDWLASWRRGNTAAPRAIVCHRDLCTSDLRHFWTSISPHEG